MYTKQKGDLTKTVDTQANETLRVLISQFQLLSLKLPSKKSFFTITFNVILQFPFRFSLNLLRLSRRVVFNLKPIQAPAARPGLTAAQLKKIALQITVLMPHCYSGSELL